MSRSESFVGIVVISVIRGADKLLQAFGVGSVGSTQGSSLSVMGAVPRVLKHTQQHS